MFKNIITAALILFVFTLNNNLYGQMESFKKFDPNKKDYELYVHFSTNGGGAGTKVKWGDRDNIQKFITFEVGGIRDDNEYITYNPYDPYGFPIKMNQKRYMFLAPLYFGFQKRLFKDTIEDDFRPFLNLELGPVLGIRFPKNHGFSGNIKRGKTALTLGGFLGAGVEFGEVTKNVYVFSMGYRLSYFFKKIVDEDRQDVSAFVIRIGIVTQF